MDKALADLIRISNATGVDKTLVQGGGGNTSVKTADGKYMYIKASGTALKDMDARRGWRRLRLEPVLHIITDKSLAKLPANVREPEVVNRLLLACEDDVTSGARPSVESHLHAYLDRCVIHLHPIVIASYVNARDGRAAIEKAFANESPPPLWIPYMDPGFMLARKVCTLVAGYQKQHGRKPAIMILAKHGLFVTAATADAALRLVHKVIDLCGKPLTPVGTQPALRLAKGRRPAGSRVAAFAEGKGRTKPKDDQPSQNLAAITAAKLAIRKALFQTTGQQLPVAWFGLAESVRAFMRHRDAARLVATAALNPDELVYANGSPLWADRPDAAAIARRLARRLAAGNKPAAAYVVKDLGLFVAADTRTAPIIAEIAEGSLYIRMQAARMGGVLALTGRERDFISNWESEAFRKQLASGAGAGQVKGRIAVVTGAGSGLGRSIAIGLARAGAMVALADIDTAAVKETADLIAGTNRGTGFQPANRRSTGFQPVNKRSTGFQPVKHGLEGHATLAGAGVLIVNCNVTDEQSVRDGFQSVLDSWGGLDILVNAAGVAPPYALVDMPVDKWRLALEVNLTGYFLMAREAARIMIAQGIGGNIVNISSKTGLDASKNNTAYNATKAGEIHMARGWAMELGAHDIRVNCVAPGNVFEGSKIWSPEYMKVCARKYGIRPDQVIPYYTARQAIDREIKGQDIADAVVFLCSDQARMVTGQTLVADGGQVMVR